MARERVSFSVNQAVGLHDTTTLKRALDSMPGVTSVRIDKGRSRIAVDYDGLGVSQAQLQQKIQLLGYPVEGARHSQTF